MSPLALALLSLAAFTTAQLLQVRTGHLLMENNNTFGILAMLMVWFAAGNAMDLPLICNIAVICFVFVLGLLGKGQQRIVVSETSHSASGTTLTYRKAKDCKKVITALHLPGVDKDTELDQDNQIDNHAARAGPNQRLKIFFGIDNCFTSADKVACKKFRVNVEKLLYVEEGDWIDFAQAARLVTRHRLENASEVSLFDLTQMITMKTMLRVLFEKDPAQTCRDRQIHQLAKEVNKQWLWSKSVSIGKDHTPGNEGEGSALYLALKAVFPEWNEQDSKSNPLNLILPGYETMWRVVMRCFIEITSRGRPDADSWRIALQSFAKCPSLKQLETETPTGSAASAKSIARETLRLYPPTRRIYRSYKLEHGELVQAAADIEALQRDPDPFWGDTSNDFRPERWTGLRDDQWGPHYMPFGARPFACPAKRSKGISMPFGVSMLALLVGALMLEVGNQWELRADLPHSSTPLDTEREAYYTAMLVRVKTQ